jgi:hypothetical protein
MVNEMNKYICSLIVFGLLMAGCGAKESTPEISAETAATLTIEARLPTLEAQVAAVGAQDAATPGLAVTAAVATANAQAGGGLQATSQAIMTQSAAEITPAPFTPQATAIPPAGGAGPGTYDGGDEHDTVLVESMSIGQSVNGELLKAFDAHNWAFEGSAGQVVTIRVEGIGQTDPVVTLLDPAGGVVGQNDDGGGGQNALLKATLESSGTYTIRVTGWKTGQYTLSLSAE